MNSSVFYSNALTGLIKKALLEITKIKQLVLGWNIWTLKQSPFISSSYTKTPAVQSQANHEGEKKKRKANQDQILFKYLPQVTQPSRCMF